ncbi:hypothetical protein [Pandoraea aquatica]|nr:hypothetical protein [Pandoraea aquatica]
MPILLILLPLLWARAAAYPRLWRAPPQRFRRTRNTAVPMDYG